MAALASPLVLVWLQVDAHRQPFAAVGGIAWVVYVASAIHSLHAMRGTDAPERAWTHIATWLALATAASISLFLFARDALAGDAWPIAAFTPWRSG